MNIEATIIEYLSDSIDVPVSADVPKNRPEEFITIERVGGQVDGLVMDHANIVVQAWTQNRFSASELIESIDTILLNLNINNITNIERTTVYNFPDPDYSMARYQAEYEVIFYKNLGGK